MKFAEKCPKCGGFVQTKSIKKSIGLGVVEIPAAQFCLNPVCDWYQDFAEIKKPQDIKEGFQFSRNQIIAIAIIIAVIPIYALFSYFVPVLDTGRGVDTKNQSGLPESQEKVASADNSKIPAVVPTQTNSRVTQPAIVRSKNYTVKMDYSHGFYPNVITINRSDTIVWSNEENQRPRLILVSKDNLFEDQLLQYPGRYQYRFDEQGKYTFVLAEYSSNKQFENTTGSVIVK